MTRQINFLSSETSLCKEIMKTPIIIFSEQRKVHNIVWFTLLKKVFGEVGPALMIWLKGATIIDEAGLGSEKGERPLDRGLIVKS